MTRPHVAEPWPQGDPGETLVTGPTALAVLGPSRPGPWPWPRDPLWQQADGAGVDVEPAWEEGVLW